MMLGARARSLAAFPGVEGDRFPSTPDDFSLPGQGLSG